MCREMTCPYHGPANRQKAAPVENRLSNAVETSGATMLDVRAGEARVVYLLSFPTTRERERFIARVIRLDEIEEAEWERFGALGLELAVSH